MILPDSGNRRQFESGAVRDIHDGKGRCDLLPLDVVSDLLASEELLYVEKFKCDGNIHHLYDAILVFVGYARNNCCTAVLEVSKHFEDGATKYGENNWKKGIPLHCYIDSAVRHYLKHLRGDIDEPHDRAFIWNLLCAIWTKNHKPELCDLLDPISELEGSEPNG